MNQPEAILNCVICNHPFDWNNVEYCPNCNWQQIDYIGDIEHTAVLLRPEREAWVSKKNYKVSDFSYEGYIPALLEAMKKIVINQITYDRSFIPNFERDPFETPEEFNLRLKQQPAFLGIAHLDAKKYDVRQERFDLTIDWHHADYMPMVFKLLDNKASYYLNMNRDQAKILFQNNNQRIIFGTFQLEKPELNDDIIFSNTPVLVGDDCIFELKSNQIFKQVNSDENKKLQQKNLDEQDWQELLNWVNQYRKVKRVKDFWEWEKAPALANIQELENLTQLYVSYNKLKELPESIGKLKNLTVLYVSYNQLTKLPESLEKLTNLTELYAWENQLTASSVQFLKQLQQNNPNLKIYGI